MKNKIELTQDTLLALLSYEELTGKLYWKARPPEMFSPKGRMSPEGAAAAWNAANAGNEALTATYDGYLSGTIFNRKYLAHRVIWMLVYGQWPNFIDHINGLRSDNRLSNLRSVTRHENMSNSRCHREGKTPGVRKRKNRWQASIQFNGRSKFIGSFLSKESAIQARDEFILNEMSNS